jgi:hypothetical protein
MPDYLPTYLMCGNTLAAAGRKDEAADIYRRGIALANTRADNKTLQKFMASDYEHKLTRADKKDHECSTCHGEGMETKIIEKLWKIPAQ